MRVKLYQKAALNYIHRCYKGAHPACGMLHRPDWAAMLEKVQGHWLEVETDHLFNNQFNTAPIPGVSELGMRIMGDDVEEIEGDIRVGRYFDRWTHKHYEVIPDECLTDERKRYVYRWEAGTEYSRGVFLREVAVFKAGD